jgi:hypothetical protein
VGGCSLADVRQNLIAGALSFVEGYAADFLAALVPPAEDIVGLDE